MSFDRKFIVLMAVVLLSSTLLIPSHQSRGETTGTPQDLISPFVSFRFIRNSQNIAENEFNSLSDMYYYISILNTTGELTSMNGAERLELIEMIQSFQNPDGGFGDWYRDRSKAGSTRRALESLEMLGSAPLNITHTVEFLKKLQITGLPYGNSGFRSSLKESDADVSSTYNVTVASLSLGQPYRTLKES